MSYVKTVWETGDVITAEKLNNIEGGIEANDPIVLTGVYYTEAIGGHYIEFDVTGEELYTMFSSGKRIILNVPHTASFADDDLLGYIEYITRQAVDETTWDYTVYDSISRNTQGLTTFSGEGKFRIVYLDV